MKKKFYLIFILVLFSCSKDDSNLNNSNNTTDSFTTPSVTTTNVTFITGSTAYSGVTIVSNGGSAIIEQGLVWSTSPNPTVDLPTKIFSNMGGTIFTAQMSNLHASTTYHVRAYATNSVGTSYGADISFTTTITTVTDIDGNTYSTVEICDQTWTTTNLNVTRYRNGDIIPQITDMDAWATATTGAWCYYENSTVNGTIYGKLYNGHAVNDPRGLAPSGWHIPTDTEWNMLRDCLGGVDIAGGKMKETGTTHWLSPNTGATNSSGFTGLSGGWRHGGPYPDNPANFGLIGIYGFWWSSANPSDTSIINLNFDTDDYGIGNTASYRNYGASVRLVRD